jgi:hypothetical protein
MQRSHISRTVASLYDLYRNGQLIVQPEFQRNSVWPKKARGYFIDTILNDRPVPLLFFQRARSPSSGKVTFYVVDGQQRLRALFDFLDDKYRLAESSRQLNGLLYSELPTSAKKTILDYQLLIEELTGYSERETRDIFKRMNRYVVKANPQEIRHATKPGAFADFVKSLAKLGFWARHEIFTTAQVRRMKPEELCAELAILIVEGPQDKKASVDLYYDVYRDRFKEARHVRGLLLKDFRWIDQNIPELRQTFLRKPVDFYSLIGALQDIYTKTSRLPKPRPNRNALMERIMRFDQLLRARRQDDVTATYADAASRQTDNIRPRQTRIQIIKALIARQI